MKPLYPILLLSSVVAGLAGALLALSLRQESGSTQYAESIAPSALPDPSEPAVAPATLAEPASMRPETRQLLDDLEQRLLEIEQSAGSRGRKSLGESELVTQIAELTARVEAIENALRDGTALEVPKEVLAETLAKVRKDEFVEKIEAYQEKRAAQLEQDLVKMQDWLELDAYQTDEMRVALQLQYDREQEQMRIWKETGDDEAVGAMKQADGEMFAEDLSRFLTPEQSETFWNTRSGGRRGSGK